MNFLDTSEERASTDKILSEEVAIMYNLFCRLIVRIG